MFISPFLSITPPRFPQLMPSFFLISPPLFLMFFLMGDGAISLVLWFLTFLMLWLFNTVPRVVMIPTIELFHCYFMA